VREARLGGGEEPGVPPPRPSTWDIPCIKPGSADHVGSSSVNSRTMILVTGQHECCWALLHYTQAKPPGKKERSTVTIRAHPRPPALSAGPPPAPPAHPPELRPHEMGVKLEATLRSQEHCCPHHWVICGRTQACMHTHWVHH
jgi:hypothetical protein